MKCISCHTPVRVAFTLEVQPRLWDFGGNTETVCEECWANKMHSMFYRPDLTGIKCRLCGEEKLLTITGSKTFSVVCTACGEFGFYETYSKEIQ